MRSTNSRTYLPVTLLSMKASLDQTLKSLIQAYRDVSMSEKDDQDDTTSSSIPRTP